MYILMEVALYVGEHGTGVSIVDGNLLTLHRLVQSQGASLFEMHWNNWKHCKHCNTCSGESPVQCTAHCTANILRFMGCRKAQIYQTEWKVFDK